jgi:hypothetical protein
MPTIGDIIVAAYNEALIGRRGNAPFCSRELNLLYQNDHIRVEPMGPVVVVNGNPFEPQQLSVSIAWSQEDEFRNQDVNRKVSLVASLLENAWDSHDVELLERVRDRYAVVSPEYKYFRGEIIQHMPIFPGDRPGYSCQIFTAFAVVEL